MRLIPTVIPRLEPRLSSFGNRPAGQYGSVVQDDGGMYRVYPWVYSGGYIAGCTPPILPGWYIRVYYSPTRVVCTGCTTLLPGYTMGVHLSYPGYTMGVHLSPKVGTSLGVHLSPKVGTPLCPWYTLPPYYRCCHEVHSAPCSLLGSEGEMRRKEASFLIMKEGQ